MNVVCWAVYLLLWVFSTWQESYYIRQMTLLFRMSHSPSNGSQSRVVIMVVVDSGCASQLDQGLPRFGIGHVTETSNH